MVSIASKYYWLVLFVFLLLLFSFGINLPGIHQYYTLAELQNTGHFVVFAFLAIIMYLLLETNRYCQNQWWLCFGIAVFLVGLGLSIEFVQGFLGRDPSWRDLSLDTRGALCGLVFMVAYKSRKSWLYSVVLLLLISGLYRLAITASSEVQAYKAFPLMADFDQSPLNMFIHDVNYSLAIDTTTEWPNNDSQVAIVDFGERTWQGITVKPAVKDWSGYNYLVLDAFLPFDFTIPLTIEINWTLSEAGFLFESNLEKGSNVIRIPLKDIVSFAGRDAVLTHIVAYDVVIKANTENPNSLKGHLFIDNIRLQ